MSSFLCMLITRWSGCPLFHCSGPSCGYSCQATGERNAVWVPAHLPSPSFSAVVSFRQGRAGTHPVASRGAASAPPGGVGEGKQSVLNSLWAPGHTGEVWVTFSRHTNQTFSSGMILTFFLGRLLIVHGGASGLLTNSLCMLLLQFGEAMVDSPV